MIPTPTFRLVPIADLHEDPANVMKHPPRNREVVKGSIAEWGQVENLVVEKGTGRVLSGNCRLSELRALGYEQVMVAEVDVHGVDATRLALVMNRSAQLAEWDAEGLAAILKDLDGAGGTEGLGWDEGELEDLLNVPDIQPSPNDDDAPEVQQGEPDSKTGEVYELGPHRLVCGDCGDARNVALLGSVRATVTDPPYGQNQPGVTNDEPESLHGILAGCLSMLPMSDGVCVAFQSPRTFPEWLDLARENGHHFERMLWLYKEAQNSYPWRGWLLTSEAILVTSKGDARWNDAHPYVHDCYKVSEVSGEIPDGLGWHGSVKPVAIVADIVTRVSHPGDSVYDPFSGSGTTLIACAMTGRVARCIEIDPHYCDVIRRRWTRWAKEHGQAIGTGGLE